MTESISLTTPVGRLVQGSLYKGQTTDAEGNPLVVKSGPNAGQPRVDYFFSVAIPKNGEQHWNQTEWGAKIWTVGQKSFPNGQANAPSFAWKIVDGDSPIPNRAGRRPCDREGFRGHWVLTFSSGYAPKIFNANGTAPVVEPDAVKLGYYVQVAATVAGNGSTQQPGIYLNHNMVAHSGFGSEIIIGPDPTSVGFGQAPLPPGASPTPVGGLPANAGTVAPPAAPVAPAVPGGYLAPPPLVVQPNPAFLTPPLPPAAPAAPVRVMLPPANGATYEQMIAAGWTDTQLVQHGMMAP